MLIHAFHDVLRFGRGLIITLGCQVLIAAHVQAATYVLGTAAIVVGPAAGSNSVVLAVKPATNAWTATANANWLHLSSANQNGVGSTNFIFSYDVNAGATRSGTITVGNQTLTVTQAGSAYVSAGQLTTLVSSGQSNLGGVAVDGVGNVYFTEDSAIKKWTPTNNIVTTLVSKHFEEPMGIAVDGAGNVYVNDTGDSAIKEWTATNNALTTLLTGIDTWSIAVADVGDVFFAGSSGRGSVQGWMGANTNLITFWQQAAIDDVGPSSVAVDVAGNIYIADTFSSAVSGGITEWVAATSNLITLVENHNDSQGVAIDGSGNLYISHTSANTVEKWSAVDNTVSTLASGLEFPYGMAVDRADNIYITLYSSTTNAIEELPYAFVDASERLEGPAAGVDALPTVLPSTQNLLPPFAPTSDQPWLTITGITNGAVSFSFTANTGPSRTANINLLGQNIPITQGISGVTPPTLIAVQMPGNGGIQITFSNAAGIGSTVLSTTNLSLPVFLWSMVGTASNVAPGMFQFTVQPSTNEPQRFYTIH
jgi:hypothetical protein